MQKCCGPPYLYEDFACGRLLAVSMEKLEDQSGRKRKRKFEAKELEVLVEEAKKHFGELQQRHLSVARRTVIWEAICKKVNAVGRIRRTVDEVKRRFQDIRRRTKEKLALNKTSAMKTGGRPAEEIPLTPLEREIELTIGDGQTSVMKTSGGPAEETPVTPLEREIELTISDGQIVGIEGYDSLEPNVANQGRLIIRDTHFSHWTYFIQFECGSCVSLNRKQQKNRFHYY